MALVTLIFDLETGTLVASKVGNFRSEFGQARRFGSRVIRYVRDRRRDGQTDKSKPYCPLPTGGGTKIATHTIRTNKKCSARKDRISCVHALHISQGC